MGQSRTENILENMLGASNPIPEPQSREETLLKQILESGGGGGGGSHTYSDEEHEVGKWVDESIVYEKTIHIQPTGDTADYTTAEAIQDVDVVIDSSFTAKREESYGTYYYTGTGAVMPEGVSYNHYKIGVRVSSGDVQYYINGYGATIKDIWATIKYTKVSS